MKIIFLDFDGVLNSARTAIAFKGMLPKHSGRKNKFRQWSKIETPKLDPVAIGLLRNIVELTGAKIVISSTWRKYYQTGAFVTMFDEYFGWKEAPVIDQTPDHLTGYGGRGLEILDWLKPHSDVTHYVILDDDVDMTDEQKLNNFVHVNNYIGLSYEDYEKALKILGHEDTKKRGHS